MATTTTTTVGVVAARNNDTTTSSLAKAVAQERHHRMVMRALKTGWRCLMIEVARDNGASSRDEDAMLMGHMMLRKVAFVVLAALPRQTQQGSAEGRAVVRLFASPLLAEAERAVTRQLVASEERMQRVYARNGPLVVRAAARATEAEFAQLVAAVRQRTVLAKALSPAQAEVPHMMIKAATCSDAAMAHVADVLVPRAAAALFGADAAVEMRPMVEAVEALRAALAAVDAAEF